MYVILYKYIYKSYCQWAVPLAGLSLQKFSGKLLGRGPKSSSHQENLLSLSNIFINIAQRLAGIYVNEHSLLIFFYSDYLKPPTAWIWHKNGTLENAIYLTSSELEELISCSRG